MARCDRCGLIADTIQITYVPPYEPKNVEFTKHGGVRNLCTNCEDYITEAMNNLWPDKRTQ